MPLLPIPPTSGRGSSATGRGPEGAAGARADTAARDPTLPGREPGRAGEGELQPQEGSGVWSAGGGGRAGASRFGLRTLALRLPPLLPQEDISRLRRKLEKQRKVEVYADA